MEDFIYILAGIAYLAYTFYNANKKSKKKQQETTEHVYEESVTPEETSSEQDFTKSIFDEILGVQELKSNMEEELYGEKEVEITKPLASNPLDSIPKEEGVRTTRKSVKPIQSLDIDSPIFSEDLTVEQEEELEFDLKQAVISAEILNPPYIER